MDLGDDHAWAMASARSQRLQPPVCDHRLGDPQGTISDGHALGIHGMTSKQMRRRSRYVATSTLCLGASSDAFTRSVLCLEERPMLWVNACVGSVIKGPRVTASEMASGGLPATPPWGPPWDPPGARGRPPGKFPGNFPGARGAPPGDPPGDPPGTPRTALTPGGGKFPGNFPGPGAPPRGTPPGTPRGPPRGPPWDPPWGPHFGPPWGGPIYIL